MLRFAGWVRNLKTMAASALAKVPDVDIDADGKFKYILIKFSALAQGSENANKLLVRGYARCNYHTDINDVVQQELEKLKADGELPDFKANVLGGGKIIHDSPNKMIKLYGSSQGYGKADHATAVTILKKVYSDYNISWSDEA